MINNDLDSLVLVLGGKSIHDIVKDECRDEWNMLIKPKWFVENENDPVQCREPGESSRIYV